MVNGNFNQYKEDVVAIRYPNGKIEVVKGPVGEIYESEQQFYSRYQRIDESTGESKSLIIDYILG